MKRKDGRLSTKEKNEEVLALCREAQKEFPNEPEVMFNLMYALNSADAIANSEEIIACGQWLLQHGEKVVHRSGAVQCLCYTYKALGNLEVSKNMLLWQVSIG